MRQQLLNNLARHGQKHLLRFWDELTPDRRRALKADIDRIDLGLVQRLFREHPHTVDPVQMILAAEPAAAVRRNDPRPRFPRDAARRRGEAALAAGEVGVILVAGGQGTRLGFAHPKGMFPIGPVSGASLFQLHLEKVAAAARAYGVSVPLYLMTSHATHDETVAFLDEHRRFGLPQRDVHVFCQGVMPAVDARSGRLLLAEKGRLFECPDGHGGMLAALVRSGGLDDARRRGLRHLFYFQVDNPLVRVCDKTFLGYHLLAESEMTSQVVAKRSPMEPMGNVVSVDGRVRIIEYSDLHKAVDDRRLSVADIERKTPGGEPVFWAGSIAVHAFDVAFLQRVAADAESLPFHRAVKKVPYVNERGELVRPDEPNAIKFERFIFDLLPEARNAIVVEVDRASHYAPVKNKPGSPDCTPEAAQAQMTAVYTAWLREAGVEVADGVNVEISPLRARSAAELRGKIDAGTRIEEPVYLC